MTSNFDRDVAEDKLKEVAAEASHFSSGDVVDSAKADSSYAHGNAATTKLDKNTVLPSTSTTVDGAYAIGSTSTADTAQSYDNKFTTPETQVLGTGSRTVEPLQERVHDLGTTVQTQTTTHVVGKDVSPVAYIPPQSGSSTTGATYSSGFDNVAQHSSAHTTTTQNPGLSHEGHHHHGIIGHNQTIEPTDARYTLNPSSGAAVGTAAMGIPHSTVDATGPGAHATVLSGRDASTAHTTGTSTTTTTTTSQNPGLSHEGHQHHGIIGHNQTIEPTDARYTLNPSSGAAVGTAAMGIPHTTADAAHTSSSSTAHHDASAPAKKESIFSKIKHALH